MKKSIISILLIIFSNLIFAQSITRFNCEFEINGKSFTNPYTGGLNSPQFNKLDVNLDGIKDLIVFDRIGNKLMVFLDDPNNKGNYTYTPQYNSIFPDSLRDWIVLKDYNNDGIEDLFTSYGAAIEVYKGIEDNGTIRFEKYINPYVDRNVLTTKGANYNLYCYGVDIPAIVDVDFDGDLDVLTFAQGNRLYFYKNICKENDIPLDSFRYIFADQCWGKFGEDLNSEEIILSDDPYKCATGAEIEYRHSGSTTLALDIDNDQDYDLLVGDVDYESIIFLKNGGNKQRAHITSFEKEFPQYSQPVQIKSFVGAFNIDVDSDNKKDLILAPNEDKSLDVLVQNTDNIHFYKNIGNDDTSKFTLIKKDFLIDEMIDFGGNIYPAFIDINADGLIDLIIGTGPPVNFEGIQASRIYYFKNTGSQTVPKFELEDDDYLNLSEISINHELHYFIPGFGDLDGDGDIDLLVGNSSGSLMYFKNTATAGFPFYFEAPILNYKNIDVSTFSAPTIVDLNKDGLGDILIGLGYDYEGAVYYLGSIVYFQNKGSLNNPDFDDNPMDSPNSPYFGKILLSIGNVNRPKAILASYIDDDDEILFTGSWNGKINIYRDFSNHIYDDLIPEYKGYGQIDIGSESAPAVADIDGDGYLEMLIGTNRGGFEFWNTDIKVKLGISTNEIATNDMISVYPNPVLNNLHIDIKPIFGKNIKYKLTNMWGKTIKIGKLNKENNKININKLFNGVFFLTVYSDKYNYSHKLVKTN